MMRESTDFTDDTDFITEGDPAVQGRDIVISGMAAQGAGGEPVERSGEADEADVLAMLLADKRSPNTRRAYAYDVAAFFRFSYGDEPTQELMKRFLALDTAQMARRMLLYKADLIAGELTEATINRRMSAILSLVKFARRVGASAADPKDHIDMERVQPYRDTRGISMEQARLLLAQPDRNTLKGKRDYALLVLLLENALRRAEIVGLTVADCDLEGRSLWIYGKGRGTQRERITLSPNCVEAIRDYLNASGHQACRENPLFINVSRAYPGCGLTADGLFKLIKQLAVAAGIKTQLSPHRLRHTSITMLLDASQGDIRKVQKLSRHARMETLQIYDDNRADIQGEMSVLLSDILRRR
jgi:integrase/recombinase XerC